MQREGFAARIQVSRASADKSGNARDFAYDENRIAVELVRQNLHGFWGF
jgi:hypothetical protein